MKLSQHQRLFSIMLGKLIAWATARNYGVTGGEWWRTDDQQALWIKLGKTKKKRSAHQDRLAVDLLLFVPGYGYVGDDEKPEVQYKLYKPLGEFWKLLGGRWGGDFYGHWDSNHFEHGEIDASELLGAVPGDPGYVGVVEAPV